MTRQAQKALDLAPHPGDVHASQAEAILAEAYRSWFACKAQEADLTGPAPDALTQAVARAWRAVGAASDRLLPFECDAVYRATAEAWHIETSRSPETGRVGYWPGPGPSCPGPSSP